MGAPRREPPGYFENREGQEKDEQCRARTGREGRNAHWLGILEIFRADIHEPREIVDLVLPDRAPVVLKNPFRIPRVYVASIFRAARGFC